MNSIGMCLKYIEQIERRFSAENVCNEPKQLSVPLQECIKCAEMPLNAEIKSQEDISVTIAEEKTDYADMDIKGICSEEVISNSAHVIEEAEKPDGLSKSEPCDCPCHKPIKKGGCYICWCSCHRKNKENLDY